MPLGHAHLGGPALRGQSNVKGTVAQRDWCGPHLLMHVDATLDLENPTGVIYCSRRQPEREERTPSGGARAGLEHRTKQAGPRTDTHPPRRLAEPIWSVANWTLK